jgi:hypothetical protein
MLRAQVFDLNGTQVTFETDGNKATIKTLKRSDDQNNFGMLNLEENNLTLPLPEFRKLMDILSKTRFMFSNENK